MILNNNKTNINKKKQTKPSNYRKTVAYKICGYVCGLSVIVFFVIVVPLNIFLVMLLSFLNLGKAATIIWNIYLSLPFVFLAVFIILSIIAFLQSSKVDNNAKTDIFADIGYMIAFFIFLIPFLGLFLPILIPIYEWLGLI